MAQGALAPTPWFTGFDANGDPLSSAKLFTYLAGTTTKETTWTDVDLSVANANPIVLDSAGRATIFLDPAKSYKFVLAPSTDSDPPVSPLKTQDNIFGVPLPNGRLNSQYTDVGNVGAGEDTLHTYTVLGGTLGSDGMGLKVSAFGIYAANANAKNVRLVYGATTLITTGTPTPSGGSWRIDAIIRRTGAATQRAIATIIRLDGAAASAIHQTYSTPAETLSGNVVLKTTGEAVADNDIIAKDFQVEKIS